MNDTPFTLIAPGPIAQRILLIQGHKVMTDADSADLYGVPTMALKQAIRRNIEHLPSDLKFQLKTDNKQREVVNCDKLAKLNLSSFLPNAFTEHGALMLRNVLKSSRMEKISLLVMRTFVHIRTMLSTHKEPTTRNLRGWDAKYPATIKPSRA